MEVLSLSLEELVVEVEKKRGYDFKLKCIVRDFFKEKDSVLKDLQRVAPDFKFELFEDTPDVKVWFSKNLEPSIITYKTFFSEDFQSYRIGIEHKYSRDGEEIVTLVDHLPYGTTTDYELKLFFKNIFTLIVAENFEYLCDM